MLKPIRISAVSYLNAKPFVFGLQHSSFQKSIQLSLDIPSNCADKLINNQADIGLVPVASLLQLPACTLISDYCIGATGKVKSVFIFSDVPVNQIKTIRSDEQSRTSNLLARVLFRNYWKSDPEWLESGQADAFVQIGDRTFGKEKWYPYAYDLSEVWHQFTGLPFVFATWVSSRQLDEAFIDDFNRALAFGLENRDEILAKLTPIPNFDLKKYLFEYIQYDLDAPKREALNRFLDLAKNL